MRDGGIYILGAGAIGLALAATLIKNGEDVLLVRTSNDDVSKSEIVISAYLDDNSGTAINMDAHVISLSQLGEIHGIIVVAAKAYANQKISEQLKAVGTESPILIL